MPALGAESLLSHPGLYDPGAVWKLGAGNEVDLVLNATKRWKTRLQVFGKDISILLQKVSNRRRNIQRWCIIKGNKHTRAYKCIAWQMSISNIIKIRTCSK
jgi:hypothetical protein